MGEGIAGVGVWDDAHAWLLVATDPAAPSSSSPHDGARRAARADRE
jgi:hypothetical protein